MVLSVGLSNRFPAIRAYHVRRDGLFHLLRCVIVALPVGGHSIHARREIVAISDRTIDIETIAILIDMLSGAVIAATKRLFECHCLFLSFCPCGLPPAWAATSSNDPGMRSRADMR